MRKIFIFTSCIFLTLFSLEVTNAEDIENRIKLLEEENARLNKIIIKLQERLDAIEKGPIQRVEKKEETPQHTDKPEERATGIEKKFGDGWSESLKEKKVKVGGKLQTEYVDTQNESNHPAGSTDIPYGYFRIQEFDLYIESKLRDDITLFTKLETNPDEVKLDQAYVTFSNLLLDSFMRIGLQERFIKANRKTETYPIAGIAFWRDKDIGVSLGGDYESFYYRLSLSNGLKLSTKEIGKDKSFKTIHDHSSNRDWNNSKQVGIGIGFKDEFFKENNIDLLLFSYFSTLSDSDIAFLKNELPDYTSNKDASTLIGGNFEYKFKGLTFFSQYIYSKNGELIRDAWYVQPSYKFKLKGLKYLYAIEPLYRYDRLDVRYLHVVSKSVTWNRKRHTFAILSELVRDLCLKLEYNINGENTGGAKVKNNEFLGQLEINF